MRTIDTQYTIVSDQPAPRKWLGFPERIAIVWAAIVFFILAMASHLTTEPIECITALLSPAGLKAIAIFALPPYLLLCGLRWIARG